MTVPARLSEGGRPRKDCELQGVQALPVKPIRDNSALMGEKDGEGPAADATTNPEAQHTASMTARTLVRLVQCPQCSIPYRQPVTLPCGFSLCRSCLPDTHLRENISYPDAPSRREAFTCPFPECGKEHPLADCNVDVTLTKVMDIIRTEVARYRTAASDATFVLSEHKLSEKSAEPMMLDIARSRVLSGGRLVATFSFAEMGELRYDSDVLYESQGLNEDEVDRLDSTVMGQLKDAARQELDCHLCYALMLDPSTTLCGHTFCRKCLARALDHSNLCPICRRSLQIPLSLSEEAGNKTLNNVLNGLCPEMMAARAEAVSAEDILGAGEMNTPIFVCTLSYPSMPTFLHIFEPRYRLMIRRAVETGGRKFGMVVYNRTRQPQGDLGATEFMRYGTMLHIVDVEMLPDGRSLIETVGTSRFKVNTHGMLDGYTVGNVERVDDVPLAEEERLEAEDIQRAETAEGDIDGQLQRMSTRQLLEIGTAFIARMRANSAPWLHDRVLAAYGPPPDDPALFPYWFASVLPISDEEKYKLLPTTSVRERLKITARWVKRIESQRWYGRMLHPIVS